ncbi:MULTISPECIES: glycerol-3-phosphate 1-O-acyltransferase PlsB [Pseudoalteromonas]|uniref:glycerol-3-phosphate 1-O-acyltransferase PlsB n=1 Tax=Pseudoalteromonas TaxID=53246 RepID=UPI0002C97575|nr:MULTISPECIES: glycerol-3-phosphate 1-O-acyltransferase PlsB [Pseudoalteromonas]MCP4059109.1 glycerol-3-phosphate 1-O-acyltransferase PlsB [Pseudoalteromonas sp.]ENN97878.1 glycerol-3-phosphate acyltransferase [Pseudoalteromonas agarivorans S816]MDC9566634.1 glycerol-3-phosphate 1-O-acyltransferase PlsB [Pseudoalteromonas sp. GAB2316C]MDC9570876.1 glycerol-3-phosphate 1-O-acyltransferase PlsB [Pseudoalteromonas sp. GABNB9D]MDC9575068.1 glycerol-3-phosphate 1-O-acyltransferase PlsB [Pseudoalt
MRLLNYCLNFLTSCVSRVLVKSKVLPQSPIEQYGLNPEHPTFYIVRLNSRFDLAALTNVCKKYGLPNPCEYQTLGNHELARFIGIKNPPPLFGDTAKPTAALSQGKQIVEHLLNSGQKNVQVVPVTILWGRDPGKEKPGIRTLITHSLTPSWFRKFFVVLFSGRDNFIRFSQPLDLSLIVNEKADVNELPQKLLRVARVHFKRQKLAATGPKMPSREQLFNSLLASPTIKKAIQDEAKSKGISQTEARQNALKLLDEIAANYSEAMIRVGDRILTWLWTKLYNGLDIKYTEQIHELTNKGHEIIYMPCHRSHMDYLLLTYAIYHQGLVPPHIAAGINLNFFPAGGIFRRSGAFFIRRSFAGNKLYSAVFKEYLSQLFIKGYSVKFYTEGGRSRTGRLLPPKTGMLAMTLQAMLRGIDRPVSIVPVYIGYEHVMEINTYLKELAGKDKKGESIFGIFKAIKNLKNYGRGYLNFGDPISINQYLNDNQPDWRDAIHPTDVQKPQWLGPQVAALADQVMVKINNAAALNAVNLLAMILLVNDKHALSKPKLLAQLDFYLRLQRDASYSDKVTAPDETPEQLLTHAIKLNKFDVISDEFGEIIAINDKEKTLFNYYRNNILHLFAVPSLIALHLFKQHSSTVEQCQKLVSAFYPLFAKEWYLQPLDENYISRILANFSDQNLIELDGDTIHVTNTNDSLAKLEMLGRSLSFTLQRYAIVVGFIQTSNGIEKAELERESQVLANRLGTLHGIKTPEFFDKKVLVSFIDNLRGELLITEGENGIHGSTQLCEIYMYLKTLLPARIWQSVSDIVQDQCN